MAQTLRDGSQIMEADELVTGLGPKVRFIPAWGNAPRTAALSSESAIGAGHLEVRTRQSTVVMDRTVGPHYVYFIVSLGRWPRLVWIAPLARPIQIVRAV
jgi:hypothetical protein